MNGIFSGNVIIKKTDMECLVDILFRIRYYALFITLWNFYLYIFCKKIYDLLIQL